MFDSTLIKQTKNIGPGGSITIIHTFKCLPLPPRVECRETNSLPPQQILLKSLPSLTVMFEFLRYSKESVVVQMFYRRGSL